MNTPEHSIKFSDVNENKQRPIDKTQGKLRHDQMQHRPQRNYRRILGDCNKPSQWYQPSPRTHSIYFYDPNYQRFLQQNPISSFNTSSFASRAHTKSRSPSRSTKHNINLHHPSNNNQQQKPILSSRVESMPKLPPITVHKKNT